MLRLLGGVIAGYATMFLLVFCTFSIAYLAMGADGAFNPGNYEPSVLWIAVSLPLSVVAAVLGGWACARIGRHPRAVPALAALVFAVGILSAIPAFMNRPDPRPTVRDGSVGNMEAMMNARQPAWISLLMPVIGAGGALAGGRMRKA